MKIRSTRFAVVAALVLPLAAACTQESSTKAGSSGGVAAAAKEMGTKAADVTKELGVQFEDMKKMADAKLAAIGPAIADLEKKAGAKSGDAKGQIETLVKQLTAKKDEITKVLAGFDLKSLDKTSIEGLKKKLEPMLAELTKMLEQAKGM